MLGPVAESQWVEAGPQETVIRGVRCLRYDVLRARFCGRCLPYRNERCS